MKNVFFALIIPVILFSSDIKNANLERLILDSSPCDNMKDRGKCAEYIIGEYNKKHNLYRSISFESFSTQKLASKSGGSLADILKIASENTEEAKEFQKKGSVEINKVVNYSALSSSVLSHQALLFGILAKDISRFYDMDSLNLLLLSNKTKSEISILDGVVKNVTSR